MASSRLLAFTAAFAFVAAPAFADRAATPEERSRIEAALTAAGFTSWEDIELEDDESAWEVDDARGADGQLYELKLDPTTLDVVRQERDD